MLDYVLVTPAHNEADLIEQTIRSVVAQAVLPKHWVIVSDGSTDGTDDIVRRYQVGRPWLELLTLPPRRERHFAAKADAFAAGYARLAGLAFDVVGNVDADVSFEPNYFAILLKKFEAAPGLGVAGTHYIEGEFHSFRDSYIDIRHVNGQIQMFRRQCFEDIGGYVPIKGGGIDWVAVRTAQMKGWETRSFEDCLFHHHRKMGTANTGELGSRFHYGKKDYLLGGHPLWQLFRSAFQMTKRPYVVGGLALLAGYSWCAITGRQRSVSPELMKFHRAEQLHRLKSLLQSVVRLGRHSMREAA